jgi:hypothetical protein
MSTFNNLLLMGAEATAESGGGGGGGDTPFSTTLIPNSVWFDGSADSMETGSLSAQVDSGNFVVATWMQRNNFSIADQAWFELFNSSTSRSGIGFLNSDNTLAWRQDFFFRETTDAAYRDIAWYHIIVSVQPTNSGTTNGDGCQIFINGILQDSTTVVSGDGYGPTFSPQSQGYIFILGKGNPSGGSAHFKGYLAQTVYLDGHSIQAGDVSVSDFLSTQTFGTNGTQFIPKSNADVALLASNAGANSFCLDYSNSSALGNDISTKGNDFTPTSMTSANQSGNTPSKMYATMNPLIPSSSTLTFAEGNRRVTAAAGGDGGIFSTLPLPTTGTTEFQMTTNNGDGRVGITCYDNLLASASNASDNAFGGSAVGFDAGYAYAENGTLRIRTQSSQSSPAFGGVWSTNDVITVRYNADANELNFLKNNVAQGTTVSTEAGLTYYACISRFNNYDCTFHFDEAEFPHTIGVGNKTINTADLATPSFQGKDFFDATLYTGNSATQTVGGGSDSKFTASAWIKSRSATSSNMLYDRVRGAATDLHSNAPDAQVFDADTLTSFLQRGGQLGADSQVNLNTGTFVLWQWLAGSSATSGVTNGTGATTSTLITSAAQNFSVGTFTGTGAFTTVGHSLGGVPDAIFVKNATTGSTNWAVYIKNITGINGNPENNFIELNTTTVATASSTAWASIAPTSTVFSLGAGNNQTNQSGATMSFMAFRSIPGVCKVGSYTGTGTTSGPFVNFEFKPRWVLIRRADSGGDPWCIIDTARTPFNSSTAPLVLRPNTTDIDTSGTLGSVDFLANGIKFNSITSAGNGSLGNYVYIAMADIGGHGTLPPIYGV